MRTILEVAAAVAQFGWSLGMMVGESSAGWGAALAFAAMLPIADVLAARGMALDPDE